MKLASNPVEKDGAGYQGRSSRLVLLLVIGLLLFATAARFISVRLNHIPHGDVLVDAVAAEAIWQSGSLDLPLIQVGPHPKPWGEAQAPLAYRGPLWPLLAAALVPITGDGYAAVRLLSLIIGVGFLLIAWITFKRLFDRPTATISTMCLACSALFIDFSGNGSLYILMASLLLAFAFLAATEQGTAGSVALGLVVGAANLLHGSGIVLVISIVVLLLVSRLLGGRDRWSSIVTIFAVAMVVNLPWAWRNYQLFGDPFYNESSVYLLYKLGVPWHLHTGQEGLWLTFDTASVSWLALCKKIARWSLGNGWFVVRKALFLVPVFAVFAPFGAVRVLRRRCTARRCLALLLPAVLFVGLTVVWPVVKFRTFTVWLPCLFALGVHGVLCIPHRGWSRIAICAGVASVVGLSALTLVAVPSHTYYYDGALSSDIFGRAGEAHFMAEQEQLESLLSSVPSLEQGPVLASSVDVHFFTGLPVVQLISSAEPSVLQAIVDGYGIGTVVCRSEDKDRLRSILDADPVAENQTFALMRVERRAALVTSGQVPKKRGPRGPP